MSEDFGLRRLPIVTVVLLALALIAGSLAAPKASAGILVLTRETNQTIAADTVVLRVTGPIVPPMAADLDRVWSEVGADYTRVLFDLDSPGGSLPETEKIVATIAGIRDTAKVDTLVRHGAMCASACVAIFVQGEQRLAGGASVWLFHGACYDRTNVPSLGLTHRYLDILREAGVSEDFLCHLVDRNYVTTSGKLWISGYELVHVYEANIITRLLEPWRPEPPEFGPRDPLIGPH